MVKRVLAFVLWGFMAWYAMNFIAYLMGAPDVIGPIIGLAVGLLVFLDPFHVFWSRPKAGAEKPATDGSAAPGDHGGDSDRLAA
jgi:hypothetical protein